ncbi:MAG: glycosyltransferase family 2 protein, partial [Candidatus Omnitrophota bacterium]
LGKGASLRRAFAILKEREDYDVVVMMDADGQHLPSDIPLFLKHYRHDHPGLIVGNRMARAKGMPLVRWLTNKFMSFVLSGMCRQPIPDSQCGFRLVSKPLLKAMKLNTENFEIESEMLLVAYRLRFPIESVPITTVYEGQESAIHPVKDTLRFLRFVFKKQ